MDSTSSTTQRHDYHAVDYVVFDVERKAGYVDGIWDNERSVSRLVRVDRVYGVVVCNGKNEDSYGSSQRTFHSHE